MTRRSAAAFIVLTVLTFGFATWALAHEGHDHKVMGTVTMAAADHLMLKDRDGKDVTIQITKDTKVRAKASMKIQDIRPGTRVVVTAVMEKELMKAKIVEVGAAPAAK